jgi:hypothetical protein
MHASSVLSVTVTEYHRFDTRLPRARFQKKCTLTAQSHQRIFAEACRVRLRLVVLLRVRVYIPCRTRARCIQCKGHKLAIMSKDIVTGIAYLFTVVCKDRIVFTLATECGTQLSHRNDCSGYFVPALLYLGNHHIPVFSCDVRFQSWSLRLSSQSLAFVKFCVCSLYMHCLPCVCDRDCVP